MRVDGHRPLKRMLALALALGVTNLLGGCATIVHGRSQTVRVTTDPPGRTIGYQGARIADGQSVTVRKAFKTPQFEVGSPGSPELVDMRYSPSVWIIGDAALALFFLIPGLIAGGIDAGTGAWRYLDDPQLVTLPGAGGAPREPVAQPVAAEPAAAAPTPTPTRRPARAAAPAPTPAPLPAPEEGIVSWYEYAEEGTETASGKAFIPEALTAAHRTLPFGSVVRVTRLDTGRSVVVTINDRGPKSASRLLDLTPGAAEQLGILDMGLAPCRVEVLSVPPR
jgi:hypothetical protein